MVPFEKVKIGKQGSVTHSHALLDVLHLERTFLQCERHKDRELSLVLDLKPGSTLHFKDFSCGKNLSQNFKCRFEPWSGGEPDGVTHSMICTSGKAVQGGRQAGRLRSFWAFFLVGRVYGCSAVYCTTFKIAS